MTLNADEVVAELAARGFRLTRQRRAVVDAVAASDACLRPFDVFEAARAACPDLGLTTVYRTLDVLDEIGALRRIHGPGGCERLVAATSEHGHSVMCSVCGRVQEFTQCDMSAVAAAAGRETGYAITGHFLQLTGVCADCGAAGATRRSTKGTGAGAAREGAKGSSATHEGAKGARP